MPLEERLQRADGKTQDCTVDNDTDNHGEGTVGQYQFTGYNSRNVYRNSIRNTSTSDVDPQRSRKYQWIITIILVFIVILVIVDSTTNNRLQHGTLQFLEWVEKHPGLGALGVIIIYILATIFFIPGSVLSLGAGFAFGSAFNSTIQGVLVASLAVFVGASIGSICAFLLGRYLFRDCVLRLAAKYPIFQAVDKAFESNGLKIMILLRLSPLIPYNALDYISGVSSISLWSYSLAMVAMIPGIIAFTFVGATASSLSDSTTKHGESHPLLRAISLIVGVVFAILGVSVAGYYSKVELNRILEESETTSSNSVEEELMNNHREGPLISEQHQVI